MELISKQYDLKAISGGIIVDEFVTENTIFYQSVFSAVCGAALGGILGGLAGLEIDPLIGPIIVGMFGAAAGAHVGFYHNQYANIKPDTWVKWNISI